MNSTPLEDRVHDGLHRTVDRLERTPFTVTDVRTRARRIQRSRRVAAGAAVAAVLAIAVPVGLAVTGPAQRTAIPPATRTPEVTGPVIVDARTAREGAPPAVPLIDATTQTLVAGAQTLELPRHYEQLTPFRDGWIGVVNDQGDLRVEVLDEAFDVVESTTGNSRLTVSPDGTQVAQAFHDGDHWSVIVDDVAGEREQQWTALPPGPFEETVSTVGFLADDRVVFAQTDPADGTQTIFITAGDGDGVEALPRLESAVSASPAAGVVAGQTSSSAGGSCSAVVDPDGDVADRVVFETCENSLGAFSPDGTRLVGLAPYLDGAGSPTLSVLDAATGEAVLDFELAGGRNRVVAVADTVWEDDETLLATIVDGNQQYVVRLGLGGTVERVAGPVTVDDGTLGLRLTPGRLG